MMVPNLQSLNLQPKPSSFCSQGVYGIYNNWLPISQGIFGGWDLDWKGITTLGFADYNWTPRTMDRSYVSPSYYNHFGVDRLMTICRISEFPFRHIWVMILFENCTLQNTAFVRKFIRSNIQCFKCCLVVQFKVLVASIYKLETIVALKQRTRDVCQRGKYLPTILLMEKILHHLTCLKPCK